jgi:hypothetical protein
MGHAENLVCKDDWTLGGSNGGVVVAVVVVIVR